MPIIRSLSTAVAASGLPLERGGSSAVGRGRAGRQIEARECLLSFGAESVVFQVSIQKLKDQDI